VLGVIPYTTFPTIDLGLIELRTFGLMVGLGVLLGAWLAARHAERYDIPREDTYRLATRMVVFGVIGARLTWDLTHWDQIENPIDLIAVWEGGLQFSGGFIAAVAVGYPSFRRLPRVIRAGVLDGYAYGLTAGLAVGRIGCYAVGEHFGSVSDFFLATRYDGGSVREPTLGDLPLVPGTSFHNTSLYEFLFLVVLFGVLTVLIRRKAAPGVVVGVFCIYYGVARGLSDFLRVNDETALGLTGAQWMSLLLIPAGVWILVHVRRRSPIAAADDADDAAAATDRAAADEPSHVERDTTARETGVAGDTEPDAEPHPPGEPVPDSVHAAEPEPEPDEGARRP
jgi:phosphatidylglycerol---prolipoprotein diacylglyceryl transferase